MSDQASHVARLTAELQRVLDVTGGPIWNERRVLVWSELDRERIRTVLRAGAMSDQDQAAQSESQIAEIVAEPTHYSFGDGDVFGRGLYVARDDHREVVNRLRAQHTAQQVWWTKLAELLKAGGMDDPAFLVGMVEAEHQAFTAQQAALRETMEAFLRTADNHDALRLNHADRKLAYGHQNCATTYRLCAEMLRARLLAEPGDGQ